MILRPVSHALRRKDWMMVAIEFALVVNGVLVALQAAELQERQQSLLDES